MLIMDNRPTTQKNIRLLGLAYVAIIPALAFMLSLIPLKTNAAVELPFLADIQVQRVLVFGGFPDCSSVCPISLSTLKQTYIHYKDDLNKDDLRVVFVNIKLNTPDEITQKYAQSFHPDFKGYSSKTNDTSPLYKTLSLKTFSNKQDYSAHSGIIYLFENKNHQWRMTRVFDSNVEQQKLLSHLL
jgi:cytochrome oxidase Cu insertion factor (SCO1/SenC/PrrC family)|tara:strand:- start:826 stop:1380 length:555 start_codon:yes stop_codon:yes gene_type:complete